MAIHLGQRLLRLTPSLETLLTDQTFIFIEICFALMTFLYIGETVLDHVVTIFAAVQIGCFTNRKLNLSLGYNSASTIYCMVGFIAVSLIGGRSSSRSLALLTAGLPLMQLILVFVFIDKLKGQKQELHTRHTQAPCLNTDLVQQHNYDVAHASSSTSSFSQREIRDPPIGSGGFTFGLVASHKETGALSAVKKPKDPDNLNNTRSLIKGLKLEQDISSTEATSLNTNELVDQQNHDVARSISSTSNFNQCKTGDPTGATEFGAVSSLNTDELVDQHNCDAANSVSCTSSFSQWEIRDPPIGVGGFAFVHVASDRVTGDLCAVKKLKDPENLDSTSSLIKEIKILSQLEHPNIAKYYGAERVGNQIWLFMEYVETGTLTKYIREVGAFRERLVRDTTAQILSALAYLHNKGVVHRDIKPDNILVDSYGFVKLIDFGLAKHVNESIGRHSKWGTSHYAAPETLANREYSSSDEAHSADIWSLACVMIEMFTGQRPWRDLDWWLVNREVCWNKRHPEIPENLSTEGKEFLQLCFERYPAKRLSASELLQHSFLS